jgi:anti-anti-sigma factor
MKSETEGTRYILYLPDRFAGDSAKEARGLVYNALDTGVSELIVDLSATIFIDSFGIGVLVLFAKELKSRKGTVHLRNLQGTIQELFHECDLDQVFSITSGSTTKQAEVGFFDSAVDIKLDITEDHRGDVCVLHMSGVMNNPQGSKFFKQKLLLVMAHFKKILLNMEDLTFIDSMSVSAIITLNKLIKETGGSMTVSGVNYLISDLFATLDLHKLFSVYETIDQALAEWK